jgi:hypothetical protein
MNNEYWQRLQTTSPYDVNSNGVLHVLCIWIKSGLWLQLLYYGQLEWNGTLISSTLNAGNLGDPPLHLYLQLTTKPIQNSTID